MKRYILPICLILFFLSCNLFSGNETEISQELNTSTPVVSSPTDTPFQAQSEEALGYMTFAINVHDFYHIDDSAEILMRLVDLFERYNVRGDFYLTAPMVHFYAEQHPKVITRLRDSSQTISYHVRPPHPLYAGFDQPLRELKQSDLEAALRDYETYRLDLTTGDLIYAEPGGYSYVAAVFERPPLVANAPSPRWKNTALQIYAELGAQMTITYHEEGTDIDQPFEWRKGLLIRPSDFSITRWSTDEAPKDPFWWNMLDTPHSDDYNPTKYLQARLSSWDEDRPAFITALIHENNFNFGGGTPWALIYYADKEKATPLQPPFDLDAPDNSHPRSLENREAIWNAYEEMVQYAAAHLQVVTSEDIVIMADQEP